MQTTTSAPRTKDRPEPPTNGWDLEGVDDGVDNAIDVDDGAEVEDEVSFATVPDVIQVSCHHQHNQPTCNTHKKWDQFCASAALCSHSSMILHLLCGYSFKLPQLCVDTALFPQFYVPAGLCPHSSMILHLLRGYSFKFSQLCVDTALFLQFYVPAGLCPHSSVLLQLCVPIALYSRSSVSPQLYSHTALCSNSSVFPFPTALCSIFFRALCSYSSLS